MFVQKITSNSFPRFRHRLIRFARLHGEKRITRRGLQWLSRLPLSSINEEGNMVLLYVKEKKILGFLAIADYGRKESFIVVHKHTRKQGIAKKLFSEAIIRLGKLYGRVAIDNTASLKTCFSVGMVAFEHTIGPTEKPTLWLGAGNWSKDDVKNT